MAQNLFEKYGVKDVADVTLWKIDRKEKTYESQRNIPVSSILKGALTKTTVYPIDENGLGEDEGFDAYIFKDADVLTHYNYDCDDVIEVKGTALFIDTEDITSGDYTTGEIVPTTSEDYTAITEYLAGDADSDGIPNLFDANNVTILSLTEKQSNKDLTDRLSELLIRGYTVSDLAAANFNSIKSKGKTSDASSGESGSLEIKTLRSDLVAPVDISSDIIDDFEDWVTDNGGQIQKSGTTITGGYITFTVRANATPKEIADAFARIHKDAYDSLGIVVRFTQPVVTSDSTISTFTGVLTASVTYPVEGETDPAAGTVTIIFNNTQLTDSAVAAIVDAAIAGTTLTKTQLDTLIAYADTDETVTVAYNPTEASTYTTVSSTTIVVDEGDNKFLVSFSATLSSSDEKETGRYDIDEGSAEGHYHMDYDTEVGTHEFSYAEQICMLFAKNQNLITKAGTRYHFSNANELFGEFEFDDEYVTAPNGRERVVVVGLAGKISDTLYDVDEVNEAIKELTETYAAKAYEITYTDYAELCVEDEMGYYLPQQLGYLYDKKTKAVSFFNESGVTYESWVSTRKGIDLGISTAVNTWGDDTHYSINDAIDALKQGKKLLDVGSDFSNVGFTRVFGGYKVTGKAAQSEIPLDDYGRGLQYEDYTLNGNTLNDITTGNKLSSLYTLEDVLRALSVADLGGDTGEIRVTSTYQMESNRAIYVDPENGALAGRMNIYLLKNANIRTLANDGEGIFEFSDKKGNKLFYQDKIFAGTAYLALVTIGAYGLIFVVDRHCTKNFTQTAWMINDNGYLTDKQAERIVKNGLIHTVTVTDCGESFDATATVGKIKVKKIKKNVLQYTPVLYLDTLKISTLEQASETTDATGGQGNAKLMTWDFNKEITLSLEDALFSPALMAAIWAGEDGDLENGVKDTHVIDDFDKFVAERNFIVPAGNSLGVPAEGVNTPQAVYFDPVTMKPYQDGTPIAEGETYLKFTRSVAYNNESIGKTIEISADKFPGIYRVTGKTLIVNKTTGKKEVFQIIIPEAKMSAEDTSITLEADGDPVVIDFTMDVLRPDNGVMMKFVMFDTEKNEEQNDGSYMVKDTENLNILEDAEMFETSELVEEEDFIGATEY